MRSIKTYNYMRLYDLGYKDLLKLSKQTPGFVKRSKQQILTYYQGTDKKGNVKFMTPSGTTPGLFYYQTVYLADLPKLVNRHKYDWNTRKIVTEAIKGNLKVVCKDPDGNLEASFLFWGFSYKADLRKYGLAKEDRPPDIRNPKLKGAVCKHLIAVLQNLPFHIAQIQKDLEKHGIFREDKKKDKGKKRK